MIVDLTASTLIVAGLAFYTAGTVGLLRFPDQRSRVHALSKADNLGLGLVLAGAALAWGDLVMIRKQFRTLAGLAERQSVR